VRGNGYGRLPDIDEWPDKVKLGFEKEALGFYITGHPLSRHQEAIRHFATCVIADLPERSDKEEVRVCGIIAGLKELTTKKGDRMAFLTLEDLSGFVETVVFPEVYQAARELLQDEEPLMVTGDLDIGDESCKLLVKEIVLLRDAREKKTDRVHFRLNAVGLEEQQLRRLKELVLRFRGKCRVLVHLSVPGRFESVLPLPNDYRVAATDEMMDAAEKLFGYNVVTLE